MPYSLQLLLTILIESAGALLLRRFADGKPVFPDVVLLNLFTHPLAHLAYDADLVSLGVIELLVVAVETVGYRVVTGLGWGRAAFFSIVLNGVTAVIGVLLQESGG